MLWAKIMKSVHGSRMLLKAKSLSDGPTREYALQMFVQAGIAPERVGLFSYEPSYRSHLEAYNRVDIALDPFPYNGTTTTCEAIWMGTPVVTLCGSLHASRVGVSILSHTGLRDLIAGTPEEYFSIAVNLANDSDRLRSLRGSLRSVMVASPLTEAGRFIRDLENTYRRIWRKWCEENNSRL
jgi:protein O-GlcNAc transferase